MQGILQVTNDFREEVVVVVSRTAIYNTTILLLRVVEK